MKRLAMIILIVCLSLVETPPIGIPLVGSVDTYIPSLDELLGVEEVVEVEEPVEVVMEETIPVCSTSHTKSYMDWSKISETSTQGRFIANNMTIRDGLLYDKDGYIGVALGSYFGPIGSRYIFVLDTGIEIKAVKVEAKSDRHTINGCEQYKDGSVIEFVVDSITNRFYVGKNTYIADGSFNNLPQFRGKIARIIKK